MPDGSRLSTAILGSRFGRRLFVMFCLAALVPATAVFWMTYRTATTDAIEARREALREGGKNYALSVYDRLQLADRALAMADADAIASGRDPALLGLYFSDVSVVERPPDPGGADGPAPTPAGTGGDSAARLVVPEQRGGMPVLLRMDGARVIAGTLDPGFLWGDPEEMSQGMRICMFADTRLFCGGHPGTEPGDRLLAARWDLFLKATFGVEPWTVVSVAGAGHGLGHYRGVLLPTTVAVLLLAVLLSSVQIRRVLVPLSDLLRRIQGLAGRGSVLRRESGEDEFGLLSRTFGQMQQRIGRQMDMLRMLSEVDRLILRGAPLRELVELVAGRMRELTGCRTVCVVTPPLQGSADALLFVLGGDGAGASQAVAIDASDLASVAPDRWIQVGELATGPVREALLADGVREVFLPAAPGQARGVHVLLGFPAKPEQADEGLEEATKLVEAIPVAVAFEEGRQLLVHQARHDSLTGLPNRLATVEAVAAAARDAEPTDARFAVAFLDLDRFKPINDGLGHATGDELLVAVGQRIRDSLAPGDLVGRFGGDEFCILLASADSAGAAEVAMHRIADALSRPVRAAGREFLQRFSAGIALFPEHGRDADTLIRNADMAMYAGKRAGGRALRMFAPEMDSAARSRLQLEQELRVAIAEGAIEVHYQPRVDSRDGRIVGAEALARWMHPDLGPVPPSTFIALAEDTGLIDDLGALVLHRACAQLVEWRAAGVPMPLVAVNVSSHQLRSRRLPETVRAALDATGLAPSRLEIEITETMLVQDREAGESQLQRVRALGVGIAIDDFGTGYSSLSYLAELPFDTIKIDRSFVLGLGDGSTPMAAIVRLVVGLATELGKNVVAEGVEHMDEVRTLAAMGCHWIQGHVYHRARPAGEIPALLRGSSDGGGQPRTA